MTRRRNPVGWLRAAQQRREAAAEKDRLRLVRDVADGPVSAHTTDDWRTCECEDCAVDRYVDYMDHRCTCCEQLPCVCLTEKCYRCATSEGIR